MSPRLSCSGLRLNPADDRQLELGAAAPDAVGDQFGFERVDERLGERVVGGSD